MYAIENGAIEDEVLIETCSNDLVLTMLVLHQKNTCMMLNEKIQNAICDRKHKSLKRIMQLKKETLEFRASGTLAPSQVSRWNNVCETYRNLVAVNGIDEALAEIEQKIELIKAEQERKYSEVQNYLATVIAVFGLVSIVASVLSIVDIVDNGSGKIVVALLTSTAGIMTFMISWVIMMIRRR